MTTSGETAALCHSVGLARATLYRRRQPARVLAPSVRAPSSRALAPAERPISVHAVVGLRKDVRDLHHLTGHYLGDASRNAIGLGAYSSDARSPFSSGCTL